MKNAFFSLFFLFSAIAATSQKAKSQTPTPYLTSKDTVVFTIDEAGEKIVEHTVRAKQTLFSTARFYGLSLEELYEYNPEFREDPSLKIGHVIRIPMPNSAILRYKKADTKIKNYAPLVYRVRAGETLFNLCKRQFRMPVDSVKQRNRLKTNDLKVGQKLHMGWLSVDGIKAEERAAKKTPTAKTLKDMFEKETKGKKTKFGQGTAFWQKDSNERGDLYALHRTAKIGSILFVVNSANNKSGHAKVIGRIPDSYEKNTEIILSPAAAKAIGAMDARFLVQLKFLE